MLNQDTSTSFNIIWQQKYQDKLREYLQRTGKKQNKFFTELLEDFLDSEIDSSFEGWYSYLIKEEGLQPEEAEEMAHRSSASNCFVPQVKKTPVYIYEDTIPF